MFFLIQIPEELMASGEAPGRGGGGGYAEYVPLHVQDVDPVCKIFCGQGRAVIEVRHLFFYMDLRVY